MIFTSMAGSPLAFLTHGFLGRITFFFLTKVGSWLANQGLALLNIGIDELRIAAQKDDYEKAIEEALKSVGEAKQKLTPAEIKAIDDKVKKAFRKFVYLV